MSNIWEFLLQTLTVSLAAALLLLLKKLFEDKLPPRWQYTVWFLLGLRVLLPAAALNRYILLPLPVWVETLKASCEQHLKSVFSDAFVPVRLQTGLPWLSNPNAGSWSITDWIFAGYVFGVCLVIARYAFSYIRLRLLLKKGQPAPAEILEQIDHVREGYGLKHCSLSRVVLVEGLPSAFVCGMFRPILALPSAADSETESGVPDEKILLHELLHLQYKDALQSMFWSLLRTLHWCNPFMQYVFNRIASDMEALCDQRVLERLEGEERRDYGRILLRMTNEKYPRAFGTTSLSNGAANITRRIQCIARFKKYPKGMALVSVCIALMLFSPLFVGSSTYTLEEHEFRESMQSSTARRNYALAESRLNRCVTLAGAVDTYAKGLILQNPYYLAAASPVSAQQEIEEYLRQNPYTGSRQYDLENQFTGGAQTIGHTGYILFNLRQADNSSDYYAELLIPLGEVRRPESEWRPGEYRQYVDEETDLTQPGYAYFPVKIYIEHNRWVVERAGDRQIKLLNVYYEEPAFMNSNYVESIAQEFPDSPGIYRGQGEKSDFKVIHYSYCTVNNSIDNQQSSWIPWKMAGFNTDALLAAGFYENYDSTREIYTFTGSEAERAAVTEANFVYKPVYDLNGNTSVSQLIAPPDGSSDTFEPGEWDGIITGGSGGGGTWLNSEPSSLHLFFGLPYKKVELESSLPPAYSARIQLNGETVDEFLLLPSASN